MRLASCVCGWAVVGCLALAAGCGTTLPNDLSSATTDANGNGFPERTPPAGVDFATLGSLNVRLFNTLGEAELAELATQYGVDASLLSLADVYVTITAVLDYGDGITDTLEESRPVAPFDLKIEVACPNAVDITLSAEARGPLGVTQPLMNETQTVTQGVQYQCGQIIEIGITTNDAGALLPVFNVTDSPA